MADRFEDERGVIQDLLGAPLDAVTEIFTRQGAVRGNHVHNLTTQWTYIVSGRLLMATADSVRHPAPGRDVRITNSAEAGPRQLVCELPGIAHAWKALEDTVVLVFTRGPRSGEEYETDTIRLEVPLL